MNVDADIFSSRLFLKTDSVMKEFSYAQLKWDFFNSGWWSRIYEYQWLKEIVGSYFETDIGNKSVIDIATGNLHPGMFILKQSGFKSVIGTDLYDLSQCIYKNNIDNGINYVKDNILKTKINDRFDCAVCISVLEHFSPDRQIIALEKIIGRLNNSGCIILTFDMPGFNYKTDIKLYNNILNKHFFKTRINDDIDDSLVAKTTNSECPNIIRRVKKRGLSCYRLFAWR
jgi:hypothetical protein